MLVSTIAITAIVAIGAIGAIGWRLVRGGDGDGSGTAGSWDRLALVDRTSGAITFVDRDGDPQGTVAGAGRVTEVIAAGDHVALVGADRIVLAAPGDDPITIPVERSSTVAPVPAGATFHLVIGQPTGGNVTVVDVATGESIDVGALTEQASPLIFAETMRHAADGSGFAMADAANFRTILVRPGDAAPRYFLGQPLAVGDELVATSQVIDREASVGIFDLDRADEGSATIEIPAGGVFDGDALVVLSVDGTLYRLARGGEAAERIGSIAVPAGETVGWVRPALDGERLVVAGTVFEAVVDLSGRTVFTTTFTDAVDVLTPDPSWTCLPVGGDGGWHSIVRLESGAQVADLTGLEVTGTSSDGCTVIGERDGVTEVLASGGSARLGQLRSAVLGPDGRTVLVQTTTGVTQLVRLDDDLTAGEPIDLGDVTPANLAAAFLDT